jgi:transposase
MGRGGKHEDQGGELRAQAARASAVWRLIPCQWKVIQHVHEKFSCRSCEAITQPPAPSHPIARGACRTKPARTHPVRKIRPASAAQSPERHQLGVSSLADWVDAAAVSRMPERSLVPEPCGRPGIRSARHRRCVRNELVGLSASVK